MMAQQTTSTDTRPEPKDLSHHLSRSVKSREASSIKQFYKYFTIPGIGQLAGGLPNNVRRDSIAHGMAPLLIM